MVAASVEERKTISTGMLGGALLAEGLTALGCEDDATVGGSTVTLDAGGVSLPDSPSADTGTSCSGCDQVTASLSGLRWSLPCTTDVGGTACAGTDPATQSVTLGGQAGAIYDVTLRLRGVVELETYSLSDAGALPTATGTNASFFAPSATPANDGHNVYELAISSPALTAYLNAGTNPPAYCFPIDYTVTLPMAGGATIALRATTADGLQYKNVDSTNTPIVVPDVPPAPQAFDGQFVQMDVISVAKR